jgi:hypothetical protein
MIGKMSRIKHYFFSFFLIFLIVLVLFNLISCSNFKYFREKSLSSGSEAAATLENSETTEGSSGTSASKADENSSETIPSDNTNSEASIEVDKEKTKDEVMDVLNDFVKAAGQQKEYEFLDSYTKDVVGNEDEYKSKAKSDIFSEIQKKNSGWKDIAFADLLINGDRVLFKIIGNRTIEGVKKEKDEESFKFIKEENLWKIDFFLPVSPKIVPVKPVPDSILDYESGNFEIRFDIISFFPIASVKLFLNDNEYFPDGVFKYEKIKYMQTINKTIPSFNAFRSLNKIKVKVKNSFGNENENNWSFVLG